MNELMINKIKKELKNVFTDSCIEYIEKNDLYEFGIELSNDLYLEIDYWETKRHAPFIIDEESLTDEIIDNLRNVNLSYDDIIFGNIVDEFLEYEFLPKEICFTIRLIKFDDEVGKCIFEKEYDDFIILNFKVKDKISENSTITRNKKISILMSNLGTATYKTYCEGVPKSINIDVISKLEDKIIDDIINDLKPFIK